jgi:signal transduction histidine kinase
MDLPGPDARSVALYPLVSRGDVFGVLEVVAGRRVVEEWSPFLEAVASQVAISLRNFGEYRRLRREAGTLESAATLGRDLVRAHDRAGAVRVAVRFVAERFEVPVAGWVKVDAPGRMELTSVRGLGSRKRHQLRAAMGAITPWGSLNERERGRMLREFSALLGVKEAAAVEAGDAMLLVGDTHPAAHASLDVVGSLLSDVLRNLAVMRQAELRDSQLDMGLAWTAHELRAPLLGVKAALELVLEDPDRPEVSKSVLRQSLRQLEYLAGTTEGVLGWAVGARPLHRRPVDLVALARDAADSCRAELSGACITVSSGGPAIASVDPVQIRPAIVNLIRNALESSALGERVEVAVVHAGDRITIGVRNRGPTIPEAEQMSIFDPFVRGKTGRAREGSNGLGLFIARRVVEAHEGEIWLESNRQGTTFHFWVPTETQRARRSAS